MEKSKKTVMLEKEKLSTKVSHLEEELQLQRKSDVEIRALISENTRLSEAIFNEEQLR